MPLYKCTEYPNSIMGIWKIEEDIDTLKALLPQEIQNDKDFLSIKNIKKQKEWLCIHNLLQILSNGKSKKISHAENGKPFLSDNYANISISHTKGYAVLLLSKNNPNIGIDIEQQSARAFALTPKFLNDNERSFINSITKKKECATLFWSIKECVFKAMKNGCVDFKKNIFISCNDEIKEEGFLSVQESCSKSKNKYKVYFQIHPEYVLTYIN